MGGNFPAGKRKGRDRREKPPIFNILGISRGKDQRPPGIRRDAKIPKLLKIEIY